MSDNLYIRQFTKLYHSRPGIPPQTVGERNMSAILVLCEFHPKPSGDLLKSVAMTDLYKFDTFDIPPHVLESVPATQALDNSMRQTFEANLETELPKLSTAEQTWLRWAVHSAMLLHVQRSGVQNQDQLDMFNYCTQIVSECEQHLRVMNFFADPEETVH